MRNNFAHAHDGPSKELLSYAAKHGHTLNVFWNNGVTDLYGLDFKKAVSQRLSPNLSFAMMNLFRICVREIDAMFASTLLPNDVLRTTVEEVIARRPDLKKMPGKVVSKARAAIAMNYGEKFPASIVTQRVEELLTD